MKVFALIIELAAMAILVPVVVKELIEAIKGIKNYIKDE